MVHIKFSFAMFLVIRDILCHLLCADLTSAQFGLKSCCGQMLMTHVSKWNVSQKFGVPLKPLKYCIGDELRT